MRLLTLLTFATLTACTSSCAGSQPRVSWPDVVACGDVVRDDLLGRVQHVLLVRDPEAGETSTIGARARDELDHLARTHGPSVIACLIDQAVRSFDRVADAPVVAEAPQSKARGFAALPPSPPAADAGVSVAVEKSTAELAAERGRDFLHRVGTQVHP